MTTIYEVRAETITRYHIVRREKAGASEGAEQIGTLEKKATADQLVEVLNQLQNAAITDGASQEA